MSMLQVITTVNQSVKMAAFLPVETDFIIQQNTQ